MKKNLILTAFALSLGYASFGQQYKETKREMHDLQRCERPAGEVKKTKPVLVKSEKTPVNMKLRRQVAPKQLDHLRRKD